MSEFWIDEFRVDVSRAQIVNKEDIISLEPRVLKVLLTLAKHQGEVVTHETLLETVWPNVVVAPNAVQRCIGQLRKALGDNAKQQRMITTHPKIGYSLVATVNWAENEKTKQKSAKTPANKTKIHLLYASLFIAVCTLFSIFYLSTSETDSPPINQLSPITSTDEKEYYPDFSPDGRYLVFNRFVNVCLSHLWVKDLHENKEYQITKEAGIYGAADWSPDGNQIAFTTESACDEFKPIKSCRSISAVSFLLAKTEPQTPRELIACGEPNYYDINWISNNSLAYIEFQALQSSIKSLSIDSALVSSLYSDKSYAITSLDYSNQNNKLAIVVRDNSQNSSLVLYNVETKETDQVPLQIPEKHSDNFRWYAVWHPSKDTLLTSVENSLFEINTTGEFKEYPIQTVANIYQAKYHPDGDKIIAAMGKVDLNIAEYELDNETPLVDERTKVSLNKHHKSHHSTVEDYQAKYQPKSSNFSFVSARTGTEQVWLSEQSGLKQLSKFAADHSISSYVWSLNGQSLALAVKGELQLLTLDGQARKVAVPFKVINIYQWIDAQTVLLSVVDTSHQTQRMVVLFDINTAEYKVIYQGYSTWAQLDEQQNLYYLNWDRRLHVYQNQRSSRLDSMKHIIFSNVFLLKNNQLSLVSSHRSKLWNYDLNKQQLTGLSIPIEKNGIANLSDIDHKNNRVFLSIFKSFKKDLVMFHQ